MHNRSRSDNNQSRIVDELRQRGYKVLVVSATERWDISVARHGRNWMFEIKQPGHKLRKSQQEFHDRWNEDGQIHRIESVEDVLRIIEE